MGERHFGRTYSNVQIHNVCAILTDINSWPKWRSDFETCKLIGNFKIGSHLFLKAKGMRLFHLEN